MIPDQGIVPCFTLLSCKEQGRAMHAPRSLLARKMASSQRVGIQPRTNEPVVESKNNRGDCAPVPRRNRVGRAGTGKRRTMRRPACNLGAKSIRQRVRPKSVAPWIQINRIGLPVFPKTTPGRGGGAPSGEIRCSCLCCPRRAGIGPFRPTGSRQKRTPQRGRSGRLVQTSSCFLARLHRASRRHGSQASNLDH